MVPTRDGLRRMTNQEYAAALREIADLYDRDERMIQPPNFEFFIGSSVSGESLRGMLKALSANARVEKVPPRGSQDWWYRLQRTFAGIQVQFLFSRDAVCKRVTKMQMVETWECPDSLLDSEPKP